jgi:hypothetical protein
MDCDQESLELRFFGLRKGYRRPGLQWVLPLYRSFFFSERDSRIIALSCGGKRNSNRAQPLFETPREKLKRGARRRDGDEGKGKIQGPTGSPIVEGIGDDLPRERSAGVESARGRRHRPQ